MISAREKSHHRPFRSSFIPSVLFILASFFLFLFLTLDLRGPVYLQWTMLASTSGEQTLNTSLATTPQRCPRMGNDTKLSNRPLQDAIQNLSHKQQTKDRKENEKSEADSQTRALDRQHFRITRSVSFRVAARGFLHSVPETALCGQCQESDREPLKQTSFSRILEGPAIPLSSGRRYT